MSGKKPGLVLAVDIGTSSLRTALFQPDAARILSSTSQKIYPLRVTPDGGAELSSRDLLRAAEEALEETLARYRSAKDLASRPIVAVGGSCFWHSFLGLDAKGKAITPVYTWADGRCREDAARLREKFSETKIHARTGCMLRASFWPARMRWLKRTRPGLFAKVRCWISPGDWLWMQWTGVRGVGTSMASGTGLFNPHRLQWDAELLGHCGLKAEALGSPSDKAVRAPACRFRELRAADFYPPLGDGAASNLGSGAVHPDLAAINFGTSGAVRVVLRKLSHPVPHGLFCYRVDAERYLVGGAVSNAGNLRAWCLRELRLPEDPAVLEKALVRAEKKAHGLTVLPFWVSERAPTWCEEIPGTLLGLNQSTTALDLLLACTEATYHRLAQIMELLPLPGPGAARFIVSGGIQRSPEAVRRMADVLGRPLLPSVEHEASLRGAAVFALEKSGCVPAAAAVEKAVRPRPEAARSYRLARQRQARLEQVLKAPWRRVRHGDVEMPGSQTDPADLRSDGGTRAGKFQRMEQRGHGARGNLRAELHPVPGRGRKRQGGKSHRHLRAV